MAYFQSVGLHVKKGKENNLTNLKADKISSVYHTDSNKKDEKSKTKETRCSAIAERPRCRVRHSFRQK